MDCFKAATWIPNASPPDSSPANCDFGHKYSAQTWPTTAWVDALSRLLAIYESADDGDPLEARIQADWHIFALDLDEIRRFLLSAIEEDHPLLRDDVLVRLRRSSSGAVADHVASWEGFSEEIRMRNRYFPSLVPDKELLSRVLLGTSVRITPDVEMFRARISSGKVFPREEMGPPPPDLSTGGRANPAGIPYLYLAYSVSTCLYEARASNHSRLCVAHFRPVKPLTVLNLADIEPPDFFSVPEVESVEDQVSQVDMHRYLRALSDELSKPARSSDNPTDYIPTQYLCEFAKSLGLDGVLYGSSLDPGGRNVVLFEYASVGISNEPYLVQITSLQTEWIIVDEVAGT